MKSYKLTNLNDTRKSVGYLRYSILFFVFAVLIYGFWFLNGRSLIWEIDGSKQHYPALVYLGQYLRELIVNFFHTGHLEFRMWDLKLGYGYDILTTLNYYSFGDPLDLLSVFVPSSAMEYLYSFLIILRMYLAGLAFFCFCNYWKWNRSYSCMASLLYVFSGYALYFGVRHPFFLNPMIYLPLLLIGLDKLLCRRKSVLFVIMVTVSLISNFYFFYMLTIAVFIYAIWRVYNLYGFCWKTYVTLALKCIGFYLVGILNAMVIFLPVLTSFLDTSRSESGLPYHILSYPLYYYLNLLPNLLSSESGGFATCLGFTSLNLFVVFLLFRSRNRNFRGFKLFLAGCGVSLLLPVVGYLFNGMSYITNRWTFLAAFIMACCFAACGRRIKLLTRRDLTACAVVVVVYGCLIFLVDENRNEINMVMLLFLVITLVLFDRLCAAKRKRKREIVLMLCIVMGVELVMKAFYLYDSSEASLISSYYDSGTAKERLTNTGVSSVKELDKGVYRVDALDRESRNYSILEQMPTVSTYYSISPSCVSDYMKDLGNADTETSFSIGNLDSRTALNTLAGVKYVTSNATIQETMTVPYGYKKIMTKQRENYKGEIVEDYIYKNKYSLPLLYSYGELISAEQWGGMSELEREQAMLYGAYINEEEIPEFPKLSDRKYTEKNISMEDIFRQIREDNNSDITVDGNKIVVEKDGTSVKIKLHKIGNSESYLQIKGADYTFIGNRQENAENESILKKWRGNLNDVINSREPDRVYIKTYMGTIGNLFELKTRNSTTTGLDTAAVNLGYQKDGLDSFVLTFSKRGEYSFDDLSVESVRMDGYPTAVKKLKSVSSKIKIKKNTIKASVNTQAKKLLCLAVPYSTGWKAYINGKETKVYRINDMYMGVVSDIGENDIQFIYSTPGIRTGALLTLAGLVLTLSYIIYIIILKKREKKNEK